MSTVLPSPDARRAPTTAAAVSVAVGLAASAALTTRAHMPWGDAATLAGLAAGGAAVAGVIGWCALRATRSRSLVAQATTAALAPVAAVAIGVAAAGEAMFLSAHDLDALLVVLPAAGAVGVVLALVFAAHASRSTDELTKLARRLGDAPFAAVVGDGNAPAPSELTAVRAELEATAGRLAAARHEAEALEHSRRELVAWVSHDLRTPLAGIRAMSEALADGVVDDAATVARYHRTIDREATRLAGLVDDLFELSRIHAGAVHLAIERVSLDDLVAHAIAAVAIAAEAKGVVLTSGVRTPSPVVDLSTPEMTRVVRNLLDNAIRHTPPGGTVSVEAGLASDGASAVLSVRDACGGIPDDDLDRVFDLAYRGDAARTPEPAGQRGGGLGLAVARGLVEAHRGEIDVANEDPGCRFTVRFPLVSG